MQGAANKGTDDPFTLLGIEPTYRLDVAAAEERHLRLSAVLHPDRHAGAPASQRREALGRAIAVNQAYRALRDPVTRAEALLKRLGVELHEEGQLQADAGLLMDIVERREALADARRGADLQRVHELAAEVRTLQQHTIEALESEFDRALSALHSKDPERAPNPDELRRKVGELRFYVRFLDEARAAEDVLD